MHQLLRQLADFPPLRDPILIAGFADQGGTTAASAVAYLVDRWDAHLLADTDPEELFDFTARRPFVRQENGQLVLDWPANRLYVARPAGATRDVILMVGLEPHLRWCTFCDAIVSFMNEVGATDSLTLGAYPDPTPHTRPLPLLLSAAEDAYGQYFSQQAVSQLLPAAGIEVPPEMPLADRLVEVQQLMARGDARARNIYEAIGIYLGYGIAHFADFYEIASVLVLGRVTSGAGGELIVETAERVLQDEFPALAERIRLRTPDEKEKRHGQAIAAASLPVVAPPGGARGARR